MKVLITLIGMPERNYCIPVLPNDKIKLVKEPNNVADNEAIAVSVIGGQEGAGARFCQLEDGETKKFGYVANSVNTKANGTWSAGRLYDRIEEDTTSKVIAVHEHCMIAQVELDN